MRLRVEVKVHEAELQRLRRAEEELKASLVHWLHEMPMPGAALLAERSGAELAHGAGAWHSP